MTNYFVSTVQSVSAAGENAQDMTGTDNLFVSSAGELVALGTGAVSGVYLNSSSTANSVTVDGEVYCADGDAIYSQSASLQLQVNGVLYGGVNGVDAFGSSNILVGMHGQISAAGTGIILEPGAKGSSVVVDGEVAGASGDGIYSNTTSDITIGASGIVSANNNGIELATGAAYSSVINDGMIESINSNAAYIDGSNIVFDNAGTLVAETYPVEINGLSVLFVNTGTITGSHGDAFLLGYQAGQVSIHNSGTIMGSLNSLAGSSGLDIENSGTWTAPLGINNLSGDVTLTNSGTIHAPINLGGAPFNLGVAPNDITNGGKIVGNITLGGTGDSLVNSGSITGNVAMGTSDDVYNSGTITGNLTFSGGANELTNTGTISGTVTITGKADTVTNNGAVHGSLTFDTSDTVANDGTIYGTVTLGQNNHFTNTGTIHGNIDAGTFDQITVNPGTLLGQVVAQNNDSFHFAGAYGAQDISGFVASGTGHDTLYFSTNDFANYTALEAHMTQASGDVLITLDAGDVVTLVGTTLSSLSSADFAFS